MTAELAWNNYIFLGEDLDKMNRPQLADMELLELSNYDADGAAGPIATGFRSITVSRTLKRAVAAGQTPVYFEEVAKDIRCLAALNVVCVSHTGIGDEGDNDYQYFYPIEVKIQGYGAFGLLIDETGWLTVPRVYNDLDALQQPSVFFLTLGLLSWPQCREIHWTFRMRASEADAVTIGVGALWASDLVSTGFSDENPFTLDEGWTERPVDLGEMGQSTGGQGYPRVRGIARQFSGSFSPVVFENGIINTANPQIPTCRSVMADVGNTQPVILFPRTKDAQNVANTTIQNTMALYGHFQDIGQLADLGGNRQAWRNWTLLQLR